MEEGTPEFRSRGEEKGAKKEFQKENPRLRRSEAFAAFPAIKGSPDSSVSVCSFVDSYRVCVEVSGVAVDGELVVLRDDGVGDLSVRPRSVLGVPVDGAHLSHARSCKKEKKRRRG